jgi:energy-coupling factor transport system permease protein
MRPDRDAFAAFHPTVNLLYFALVLTFSMWLNHPVYLALSFGCAFAYSLYLNGKKALRFGLIFLLPTLLLTALLNPAFNHQGATILTYLPTGNPLTLESIIYGWVAALMLIGGISWFSCFNVVMTSDKFVYLFGRLLPALSLILSMTLRFVPRFRERLKVIANAQKCLGRDISQGGVIRRVRQAVTIFSIMVTWALENSIETADSMKCRGYGLPGRTAFSFYRFDGRDCRALVFILLCAGYIIAGAAGGGLYFRYFPTARGVFDGGYTVSLYLVYVALGGMPLAINLREDHKWKAIASRI